MCYSSVDPLVITSTMNTRNGSTIHNTYQNSNLSNTISRTPALAFTNNVLQEILWWWGTNSANTIIVLSKKINPTNLVSETIWARLMSGLWFIPTYHFLNYWGTISQDYKTIIDWYMYPCQEQCSVWLSPYQIYFGCSHQETI